MLAKLRAVLPPEARERLYVLVAPIVALLASVGLLDASMAAQWSALVVSFVTLLFALLHSTSTLRTALYGVLAAVAPIAQVFGILTGQQWASILFIVATLLGVATAAAKAPTGEVR